MQHEIDMNHKNYSAIILNKVKLNVTLIYKIMQVKIIAIKKNS